MSRDKALRVSPLAFSVEEEWSPGEIVVDRCDQYVWFAERTTTIRLDNPILLRFAKDAQCDNGDGALSRVDRAAQHDLGAVDLQPGLCEKRQLQ